MLVLEAAGYDPLRAQQMEAELSRDWWERYEVYHNAAAKVANEQQRKAEQQSKRRR